MKHCYDCHKCVATFDHHCLWIDNCVGEKNRPLFFICILFNLIAAINAFILLVAEMWRKGEKETYQISFLSFVGILIGALIALVGMHSFMMVTNLTTCKSSVNAGELMSWDKMAYFKRNPLKTGSSFSQGVCRNVKEYWMLPFSRSYQDWTPNASFFNQ